MDLVDLAAKLRDPHPNRKRPLPTISRLREVLSYNPETGELRWKIARRACRVGEIAGRINHGYRIICIDYSAILAHRIAWAIHYGEWPMGEIDHRDGNKDNNAIDNLRDATASQNQANKRGTGQLLKGVTIQKPWRRRKFQAQIKVHQKQIYLGLFETEEEAHAAYREAARCYFGEYARFK